MKQSLLLLLISTLLSVQVFCDDTIWAAYKSELFSFLKGGHVGEGMQLFKTPIEAIYDINSDQRLEDILNPISKWGPSRELVPNQYFHAQYFDFLANLKISPLDPAYADRINEQREQLKEAALVVETERSKCDQKYQRFVDMGIAPSKDAFISTYCSAFTRAVENASQAEGMLRLLISTTPDQDVRDAQSKMQKATEVGSFPWKEHLSSLKVFRNRIEKEQTNTFRITINKSTLKNTESKVEWSVVDGESFIQNANGKSFSMKSSNDMFSLDIRALGYHSVNVVPDEWYSAKVVSKRKNGPFIDKEFAKEFFGKDKKLSMIPSTLYFLYKPEIVLQVGSEDVDYFRKSSVLHIGPFFGRVHSITELKPTESERTTGGIFKVVVRDSRDHPLIVAMDHRIL